jgi:cell shape-determining protein MreC
MKRTIIFPYVLLGAFLLVWASLSKKATDQSRECAIASLAPAWRWLSGAKPRSSSADELTRLKIENQHYRTQMEWVREWLLSEKRLETQAEHWKIEQPLLARRAAHLMDILRRQMAALPAQIIYRDASSWSSTLWLNVGEEDNRAIGYNLVSKNSPVVSGLSLIGVVDYVGKKQSRVRLITDSGLSPSVRVSRGISQNREIIDLIDSLNSRIQGRDDLPQISSELEKLKSALSSTSEELFLAKGELHGSSAPFWRSRLPVLKGVGFNYDYEDEAGPARDLRTGRPLNGNGAAAPLLKVGDLLVTSGLDGLFPPGLSVATVSSIAPLSEGGYAYEIEARPTSGSLDELDALFVLPHLSGD